MNDHHHTLTPNAILYISLGFHQSSLLQVIDLRPGQPCSLQLVLYDGIVYTGALYDYSKRIRNTRTPANLPPYSSLPLDDSNSSMSQIKLPKPLDIVRVQAVLLSKNQPLQAQVHVESGIYEVLGREIITLEEYMKRRRFVPKIEIDVEDQKEEDSSKPSKHFKSNEEHEIIIEDRISPQKETIQNPSFQLDSNQENSHTLPNPLQNKPNLEIEEQAMIIETQKPTVIDHRQTFEQTQQLMRIETQPISRGENSMVIQTQQPAVIETQQHVVIEDQKGMVIESQQLQIIKETQIIVNQPPANGYQVQHEVKQQENINTKKPTPTQNIISLLLQQDQVQIIQPPKTQKQKNRTINLLNPLNVNPNQSAPPIARTLPNNTALSTPTPSNLSQINHAKQNLDIQSSMMIKDLYQRMHRFRILCRINHLSHFTSQKGKPCTKMVLIDQKGDQIPCFLLQKASQRQSSGKLKLLKGRSYLFQNGQVEKDEMGALSITVPWSGILQTKTILPSFNSTKMLTAGQIESISSTHFIEKPINTNSNSINNRKAITKEVNLSGVFAGLRQQPKLMNNQFKVSGTLCDPDMQKSINFSLFVQELSSFPTEGAVLSLHNFKIAQHEGTYKLQCSKRSYYLVQNNNPHPYFSDLKQASAKQSWKLIHFKNLSQINYLPRTIAELKQILSKMLEHDHCFSEIEQYIYQPSCSIASIQQKRQFPACATCRRQTKPERGPKTYCYHCKKIQNWNKRFLLTSEVADSTGSVDVTLYSEDIPAFIHLPAQDYVQMTKQDRTAHLELSTYQNVLLKIKSQRIIGGSVHYVNKAESSHHKRALMQIKDKTIQKRTTYQPPW